MSETTKPTPGPWTVGETGGTNAILAGGQVVAFPCADQTMSLAQMWANANLICAAPDLLEALEHMRHCQSCAEAGWEDCEGGRQAIAALSKARGESPDRGNRARGK